MPNPYRQHWTLDPEVVFLNHGSYGACPARIQQRQQRLRADLEHEPVRFMRRHKQALIDRSREVAARLLNAPAEEMALVPNATHGVNAVMRSLSWKPGDEVLVTDHEYNACRNTLNFAAERAGAKVVVAKIPVPVASPDQVVEALLEKVSDRTVFCLVDHITSPTALVLPVERIVPALQERGVEVLVDGAHAPGQVEVDLRALGADYYTGNMHKWVCAPKGTAVLHVREEHHHKIRPTVISHGANADFSRKSRYLHEFDWTGTFDPTAWGCIAEVIEFMEELLPGGWPEIRRRNHALALEARAHLMERLGTAPLAPASMIGTMASVILPAELSAAMRERGESIFEELTGQWGIEIPVIGWGPPVGDLARISCHLYNEMEDYRKLGEALESMRP